MNLERIKDNSKQEPGKVSADDTLIIARPREELAGKLPEGYGIAKDKTDKTTDKLTDSL